MMDWTDRHDRFFLRLISRHARLYTEMVTTRAILFGDKKKLLDFNQAEHPLALQIGGSDVVEMTECARIAEDWAYDEVNINVGCPSDRVQSGRFGACLMTEPGLVAECVESMVRAVSIPITVKCRIGVDDQIPEEALPKFIDCIANSGCQVFLIHARKARLSGLSPAENRNIPPLDYSLVKQMKSLNPHLKIVLNGGIQGIAESKKHLLDVDGVMLGRAAYRIPWGLSTVDREIFKDESEEPSRENIVNGMIEYASIKIKQGVPLKSITRHMIGLFHAERGARTWRRILSEEARVAGAGPEVIRKAADFVNREKYDEIPKEVA